LFWLDTKGEHKSTAGLDFADFVGDYLSDRPSPMTADIGDPIQFFLNRDGEIGVDHVFAYEDTGSLVAMLTRAAGGDGTVNRRNVSPPGDVSLPPALRQRLESRLARAVRLHRAARAAVPTDPVAQTAQFEVP
jgi:hypothetical protein